MKGLDLKAKRKKKSQLLLPIIFNALKSRAINMIIFNRNKIKSNQKKIKEILKEYRENFNFSDIECPKCGSDDYILWGGYDRNIYYMDDGKIVHEILRVRRIKCNKCGKTHALLPEFIVPYKQALLDIILLSINDDDISYTFPFSYETIINWKRHFKKLFLPYLKTMFTNVTNIIDKIIENIFDTYERFYYVNKKILMMTHLGIFNMGYF